MKATILIRCLNEIENLKKLLPILEKQNNKNFEIVFIDSGSNDGSYDYVKNYKSDIPIILEKIEKEKFSFGRSLNMAAKKSNYKDILISLSAHCFPTSNSWLDSFLNEFQDEKIKIVFGKQIGEERSQLSESSHLNSWFGEKSELRKSPFTNNGNAAFRYETWSEHKFDEELTGCEDIEFAKRVIHNGGLIFYSAESVVTHYHNENKLQIRNRYRRESQAIKSIFIDDIEFTLSNLIVSTIKEIIFDVNYRKKNNSYPKSSFLNIFLYRYNKNLGHYLGINFPIKSIKAIQNNYYSYVNSKIYTKEFKRDYFYK